MRKFEIAGDPQIQIQMQEIHSKLKQLKQAGKDTDECQKWLEKVEEIFKHRFLGFCHYSTYDMLWQALHKIRHILCRITSPPDLIAIAIELRGSLDYIDKPELRKQYENDLNKGDESLRFHVSGGSTSPSPLLSMNEIRDILERLSMLTSGARDTHWRKVNLLRTRLVVTAVVLGLLLLSAIFLVPRFLSDVTSVQILTIIIFGALGGLVSALQTMEPLEAHTSAYYVRRTLLGLKPVIGAAAGLFVYLIQLSGIVSIVTVKYSAQATYLALSFAAGFSERFFMSQIDKLAGSGKKKEKE